ncbi:MAG: hypothetical protein FD177_114 [Desulfovibrionaceae bacterium]|nr:MAG: hypothetical protein FD177_114 [Desulfovibrionaceae bacterium]
MASHPAFPSTPPVSAGVTLSSADNGAWKQILEAPADGSGVLVGRLRAVSDDTAGVSLIAARNIGGTYYRIGCATVPAGAGNSAGVAWKDLLADLNLGESLALTPSEGLFVMPITNITAAKTIWLHLEGAPL